MSVKPPTPPNDSPSFAIAMLRDIVGWVQAIFRQPLPLARIATAELSTVGVGRGAFAFDDTLAAPTVFNGTSWTPTSVLTLAAGTYTPTLFNVTNVAASTAYACQYMRVGSVVNVSGKVDVDPTLVAATVLGISLPIASILSAAEKCAGIAASNSIASEVAAIDGDTVNNRAQMDWITTSLANHAMYFEFQYLIT